MYEKMKDYVKGRFQFENIDDNSFLIKYDYFTIKFYNITSNNMITLIIKRGNNNFKISYPILVLKKYEKLLNNKNDLFKWILFNSLTLYYKDRINKLKRKEN